MPIAITQNTSSTTDSFQIARSDSRRFAIPSLWEASGLQGMTGSLLCIKTPLPNKAHSFLQHNDESRERCVFLYPYKYSMKTGAPYLQSSRLPNQGRERGPFLYYSIKKQK
jgi:hypothetical protein